MTLIGIYNLANLTDKRLWGIFLQEKGFPNAIAAEVIRIRSLREEGYVGIHMDKSEVRYYPKYPQIKEGSQDKYLLCDFTEWGELTARMNLMGKYLLRDLAESSLEGNSLEIRDHTGKLRVKVGGQ